MEKVSFISNNPEDLLNLRSSLLTWFKIHKRNLPWRSNPNLYKTVLSEFMLQQTRIETALPYFYRWTESFPDFKALAEANLDSVLKHWEGLGYYNRARNLHKVAQYITQSGKIPSSFEEWKKLPGIGDYTAAAISSIEQNLSVAVVDGNVVRVLARLTNQENTFKGNSDAVNFFRPLANKLIDQNSPGDFNQAMMELGATLCQKAKPQCQKCPLIKHCKGLKFHAKNIKYLPRIKRTQKEKITLERAIVFKRSSILLHKINSDSKRLRDHYEIPLMELIDGSFSTKKLKPITRGRRAISNQSIEENWYKIEKSFVNPHLLTQENGFYWVDLKKIDSILLTGPHRRWLKNLLKIQNAKEVDLINN